jgi:cytochrome c oxidase subunit 2
MAFLVVAEEPEQYERWAQAQREAAAAPADETLKRGQEVFLNSPCVMCHAVRGTSANAKAGPDLTHVGSRTTLAAGTLANTRGNLAGWISDPHHVKPGVNMPAVTLPAQDLQALVSYLESLK